MAGGTPVISAKQAAAQAAAAETAAAQPSPAPVATSSAQEAAAITAGIPGSTTTNAAGSSGYIGMDNVPTGYRPYVTVAPTVGGSPASRAGQSLGVPAGPDGYKGIYKNGSDYTEWQDMTEAQRVQVKTQLWYAGFYGKNRPVLTGDVSPEDITAMNGAMALGNLNGKKWEDAIAPRVTMGEQMGGAYDPNATKSSSGSSGTFDQAVTRLRDFALNNGIDLTEDYIGKTSQQIATGQTNIDTVLGDLRDTHVARAYPGFAKQIMAGQDVRTIADPYIAKMANTLEVDPNTVSLSDPTLAKALQAVDDKGNPASVPLWQFDQMLKQDSRWQYTNNAWKDVGDQAMQIAQMFGLQG
jgi:hypothetical protein